MVRIPETGAVGATREGWHEKQKAKSQERISYNNIFLI